MNRPSLDVWHTASRLVLLAALLAVGGHAMSAEWESVGPFGGDQFDVRIAPGDPDTLYALSVHGLHRSRDGGDRWSAIDTRDMFIGFTGFNIDPRDILHLHTGTFQSGIWQSRDGGDQWSDCSEGLPTREETPELYYPVVSLAQSADGRLFAGLSTEGGLSDPPAWIYSSQSGCNDWVGADSGIQPADITLSQTAQTLLTTDPLGRLWAMSYGAGVYRYDAGQWLDATGNLPEAGARGTFLAHDPGNAERLLLATEDQWVFETIDSGASWAPLELPESLRDLSDLPLAYMIAIDPNNDRTVFVQAVDASIPPELPLFNATASQTSGLGLYVSYDGAQTWEYDHTLMLRLAFDASETVPLWPEGGTGAEAEVLSRIWYVTTVGMQPIVKYDHVTQSAEVVTNGIEGLLINRLWLDPRASTPADSAVLASAEGFLFRYYADPGYWDHFPTYTFAGERGFVNYNWSFAADWLDEQRVFIGTGNPAWQFQADRGVYVKSLDCFSELCDDLVQLLSDVGVWQVISTPARPATLYAATQGEGLLVSEDRGTTWSELNQGLPAGASVTDLILDAEGRPLLAGLRSSTGDLTAAPPQAWWAESDEAGGVYVLEAEGWIAATGVDAAVLDLEAHPTDAGIVYAATSRGVFRSVDGGRAWESVAPGLIAYSLAVDAAFPDYVYAGAASGVFRSTTAGVQWHDISDGLPLDLVHSLILDPQTGVVFAGTGGNSVYRLPAPSNPQPVLELAPISLEFGIVPVGFHRDIDVVLKNNGEADLVIDDIVSTDGSFGIAQALDLPLTIPPRSESTLSLRFSPQSVGTLTGQFVFSSNDVDTPQASCPVRGEGRLPVAPSPDARANDSDSPAPVVFGGSVVLSTHLVAGDYTGRTADFWVTLTTPDGTDYWLVEQDGWVASATPRRAFVAPIRDYTEGLPRMEFTPVSSGEYVLRFAVDDNADGIYDGTWSDSVSFVVDLRPPIPVFVPESLDFGSVPVGSSRILAIGIGNAGEQQLTIDDIEISAPNVALIDPPALPLRLGSGESAGVVLRYAPDGVGPLQATVTFRSNAAPDVISYLVTGEGREADDPVPDARIDGADAMATVGFGQTVVFSTHLTANDHFGRDADLWISWTIPQGNTFWLVYGVGWVAAETPQRFIAMPIIDFDPWFEQTLVPPMSGVHTFTFAVDDNADGVFDGTWTDSASVSVGQRPPSLVVMPETLAFGDVAVGFSKTLSFGVGNSGEQPLVVESIDVPDEALEFVDPPAMPFVLGSGESTVLSVSYSPSKAGELSGSLLLSSNAVGGAWRLPVSGAGREAVAPTPIARVDGSDQPRAVELGQTVSLSTHLSAGDLVGREADYWVSMTTPEAGYWLVYGTGWVVSETPLRFLSLPINDYGELFSFPYVASAPGEHVFGFAVDEDADGEYDATWSASAVFTVEAQNTEELGVR